MNDHDATHIVDDLCCTALEALTKMMDAAYQIGASKEVQAAMVAIVKLHRKAEAKHAELFP